MTWRNARAQKPGDMAYVVVEVDGLVCVSNHFRNTYVPGGVAGNTGIPKNAHIFKHKLLNFDGLVFQ